MRLVFTVNTENRTKYEKQLLSVIGKQAVQDSGAMGEPSETNLDFETMWQSTIRVAS